MRLIGIVLRTELREMRRTSAFRVILIIAAAVTVAAAAGISVGLNLQSWLGAAEARPMMGVFIGLVLYFLPFIMILTFVAVFGNLPVIKEKVNGGLECLMGTPMTPKALWLGKALAAFLPAYIISLIDTLIVVLIINWTAMMPAGYGFVMPGATAVLGLFTNPLLFFGLLLFMILFAMANNPDAALAPMFLLSFGLMIGLPAAMMTGTVDITSWTFSLGYLGGTIVAMIAVLYLSRMLTRQNIVLSSKGA